MAILQNVGDIIQVTFLGLWHSQQVQNTFRYQVFGLVGSPTVTTVAAQLEALLTSVGNLEQLFLALCPPQYALSGIRIQTIVPTRVAASVFTSASVGTFGFGSSTANLAGVITRRGALANKHNVGSIHVPYPNLDTGITNGKVSTGWVTAGLSLAGFMVTNLTVSGGTQMAPVLSWGKAIINTTQIDDAFVQATLRTMRRRTVGVGK